MDMTVGNGASTRGSPERETGWVSSERLRSALAERSIALDRELGRGGMSIVYLARDLRHDRLVAVKILRPGVPAGTERFLGEIKIMSPLVHPNIVPLFDSGAIDGFPFFVMPYIEGQSLRRRLQEEGWLEVVEAVRIAGEIGEALEFAHEHDVLHRDIKPENILLHAGHALVTDFGVARAVSEVRAEEKPGEHTTEQEVVVGTAEYMSPEQASGDQIDGRTDVYSLGCVLYEMLTGGPPFTGSSPREVIARRFRESPRPVREVRPDVPPHLEAVVKRAIAADPADRFATATEFLVALRLPEGALPSAAQPARRRHRFRWPVGMLSVGTFVALAIHATEQPRLDSRRIVVAPLSNETGDSSFSYLSPVATGHITASLAGAPGIVVVTSATVMPSRVNRGLQVDSLDDPARLRALSQETEAGTVVSGSYFRSGDRISFWAEITDANDGTLLDAVGPVTAPVDQPGDAIDSLVLVVEAGLRRELHTEAAGRGSVGS